MVKSKIPSPKKRSFLLSETFQAVVGLVGSLGGAGWLVYKKLQDDPDLVPLQALVAEAGKSGKSIEKASAALSNIGRLTDGLDIALLALAWVAFVSVFKLVAAKSRDDRAATVSDPYHLLGPLLVLQLEVKRRKGIGETAEQLKRFRATLHGVEKDAHVQCVPYVGHSENDGTRGPSRKWPNHCGLVGRVARLGKRDPILALMGEDVKTTDDYVAEMMKLYGYTREQASHSEHMRLSALAIPILDGSDSSSSKVIGVVYCDSSERDFFDEETVNLCVVTAMAIAKHLRLNY